MRMREPGAGRPRLIQAAIGVVVVLGPSALADAASAATLTVDRPCYVNARHRPAIMSVAGTGFTAGDTVNVTSNDGTVDASATADGAGNITLTTNAPIPFVNLPVAKAQTLTATDFTPAGTTTTATTTVTSAPFGIAATPSRARLTAKVTWYFAGFKPGAVIYGHYVRKRQVARARFGRAQGPCGVLKTRARFYPGGHPRFSSYKLQLDNSRRYSRHTVPRFVTRLTKTIL